MIRRSVRRWALTLLAVMTVMAAAVEMHGSEGVPHEAPAVTLGSGTSTVTFAPMLHWRQLRHSNSNESKVPEPTLVPFVRPAVWEASRWPNFGLMSVVAAQAVLIGWLLVGRRRRRAELDVEARRQETRTQMMTIAHLDRRVAIGEVAAAIAHELNQPLEAILHNAEAGELLLESGLMSSEEMRNILADIRRIDTRAAQIIQRLRGMLRKKELESRPVDVNVLARETVEMVSPVASSNGVHVKLDLAPSLDQVSGDQIHLQQVLLNVMLNGIEAMSTTPRDRRQLSIRTVNVDQRVEISVKDCGLGIRAKAVADIFDPFYTTKGEGMGIGLSIARQIVAAHGGQIAARNNADGGATVWFALPASAGVPPMTPHQ